MNRWIACCGLLVLVGDIVGAETTGWSVGLPRVITETYAVHDLQAYEPEIHADAHVEILERSKVEAGYTYRLRVTPYVSGELDISNYLFQPQSSAAELPPRLIQVGTIRFDGNWDLSDYGSPTAPAVGWYERAFTVFVVAWVALGLVMMVRALRHRRQPAQQANNPLAQLTSLVEQAQKGLLDQHGLSRLEKLLLHRWRMDLQLVDCDAAMAIARIRADEHAGALLRQVELWLHAPTSDQAVDVERLLAPYSERAP